MAAPAPVAQQSLVSGADDATYNTNMANILHSENNLIGGAYGTTQEIGGELGQRQTNLNTRTTEQLGNLRTAQNERNRLLSLRAGANIQSGIFGTERANMLQGFAQRTAGVQRGAREGTERIANEARKDWEGFQQKRSREAELANQRYANYVARNPGPAAVPPGVTVAGGGPPGSHVTVGPGSPGQPIQAGFGGNYGGSTPVGGFGTPGNLGVIQVGGVRAGRPTFYPPPKPKGRR